jgi:hypothetical protein
LRDISAVILAASIASLTSSRYINPARRGPHRLGDFCHCGWAGQARPPLRFHNDSGRRCVLQTETEYQGHTEATDLGDAIGACPGLADLV